MDQTTRKRLTELGPEALADALLAVAQRNKAASEMVESMTSAPADNVNRLRARIRALAGHREFVDWRGAPAYAGELVGLLDQIRLGVDDPKTGADLVAAFYEADDGVFSSCDDSDGDIGEVFRCDAKDAFVQFARGCEDKQWLAGRVLELNRDDPYGVRDALIACATEYLPEPVVRSLVARMQQLAVSAGAESDRRHWHIRIGLLARQIRDPRLFEQARIASWPALSAAACADIAQAYLESGDAEMALSWLTRVDKGETFQAYERDRLLLATYGKLGRKEEQAEVAWRLFRRGRSEESLRELLAVIGAARRDSVIEQETRTIMATREFSPSDAEFLVKAGRIDEAEAYVLDRVSQLNGAFYGDLLALAEPMASEGRRLAATLLYRALLDSILERARAKAYHHGVDYLRELDRLACAIADWRGHEPHAEYRARLRTEHGRKKSFWGPYERK